MPPLNGNILAGFFVGGGFFLIGCLTWYFSTRRKAFIRTFIPPEMLSEASGKILRDESFGQGKRFIAFLQMSLGVMFALIALYAWLC